MESDKLKRICPRYDTHPFLPLPNVTGEQETGSHRRFEAVFFQTQRLYVGLHSKSRPEWSTMRPRVFLSRQTADRRTF